MAEKQEQSVARFIANESASKNVIKYILRHISSKGKGVEVEVFEIMESLDAETCRALASSIYSRAQMDADGYGPALQRYMLFSVVKDGETEKLASRIAFRCKGETDMDLDEEESEDAPTNRGLLAQLMRHNENNNRTLVAATQAMTIGMARQIDSKDKTIEKLLGEREKMMELIEDAHSNRHEREIESLREGKKQERIDMAVRKAMLLAPVALDHFTGGKIGAPSSSEIMVKELAGTLTPQQIEAFQKVLSPEQLITLFRLIESANKSTKALVEGEEDNGSKVS